MRVCCKSHFTNTGRKTNSALWMETAILPYNLCHKKTKAFSVC